MSAPSADVCFWGFLWWIKHNSLQSIDSLTEDDLDGLATAFAAENSDALSAADPATYTDLEWPGTITAAQNTASCEQSTYPKQHFTGH